MARFGRNFRRRRVIFNADFADNQLFVYGYAIRTIERRRNINQGWCLKIVLAIIIAVSVIAVCIGYKTMPKCF